MTHCRWVFPAAALLSLYSTSFASAQELLDPRLLGLNIPPGLVVVEADRRVTALDELGQPMVGKVHVSIGDQHVLLCPDGQLVVRPAASVEPTDRPFEPLDTIQLAQRLRSSSQLARFSVKQTRHYLFIYNTSEPFLLATSRILESMFSGVMTYMQGQRLDVHEPDVPLVVVMFRTEAEFQRYQAMPPEVVAYYNMLTNQVVLYEESPLTKVRPELGRGQTISTIAHEGAHQILHNIGVQQRLAVWPLWINEGLAEYFAPTSVDRRLKWKGVGQVNELRMLELEEYFKGRSAQQANGQMVRQTIMAAELTSTGYAAAWALTHFLAKAHRQEFHDLLRELSKLKPLDGQHPVVPPGLVPENLVVFKRHVKDDFIELEKDLLNHLRALPYQDPFAQFPYFVAMVTLPEGNRLRREAKGFHSEELAGRWSQQQLARIAGPQRSAAQAIVREFPNRRAGEEFRRRWMQQP